ncbi:hypothetical protein [Pseudarthrobacter albicanus]|uniref:hypothetical protein n=1 Tax=Pseudarthrobacter albicanus TaxID=2823873 RepID=UPI001BA91395|nr:hypothetical protein [Pseudarthrobacter albicanus]
MRQIGAIPESRLALGHSPRRCGMALMSTDPAGSLTGWSPIATATKKSLPRGGCLLLQVLSFWQLQAGLLHERAQAATSDML